MTHTLTFEPLQNKYSLMYFRIIENRCANPLTGYVERHHVQPECLGGPNTKSNIVPLSAREHYICHLLLTKMLIGEPKKRMHYAFYSMRRRKASMDRYVPNSLIYEITRKRIDRTPSEETRAKMSASQLARPARTAETKLRLSSGVKESYTQELREVRSRQFKGKKASPETRTKMSTARTGTKRSEESKAKQGKSISGANHHAAKTWVLLSPRDEIVRTNAMSEFCKEHGLNYFSLRNRAQFNDQRPITRGDSKGWCVLAYKSQSSTVIPLD